MKNDAIFKIWLEYLFLCYNNTEILQGINPPVTINIILCEIIIITTFKWSFLWNVIEFVLRKPYFNVTQYNIWATLLYTSQ